MSTASFFSCIASAKPVLLANAKFCSSSVRVVINILPTCTGITNVSVAAISLPCTINFVSVDPPLASPTLMILCICSELSPASVLTNNIPSLTPLAANVAPVTVTSVVTTPSTVEPTFATLATVYGEPAVGNSFSILPVQLKKKSSMFCSF